MASALVTVFVIRSGRDRKVARELLGENTTAIVGSDRFTVYDYLSLLQRQTCWAHRYKRIIGDRLRAIHCKAQKKEELIAVNVINRMTALGMPQSVKVVV